MASSSSASSIISYESESSREPTPEYDPITAYEVRALLHWDAEEWDFRYQSEDDESLTDGEDLALFLGAELEEDEDDASWGEDLSSSEERADSFSSEEDPMAGTFLFGRSSDETSDGTEGAEDDDGFSSDGSGDNDDGSSDSGSSGTSIAPPSKRRKTSGMYWWLAVVSPLGYL
ncbi:hypothetical protein GQ55_8G080200 [Panicum hallii var. hallii]|uniref:Uncharacterized protein n=1 Tax=Panicum hallii var. hallii TaxID=1504633 RepID=A0A2T7CLZ0_9POAL|nr:hypothetical protein GQ55_8G080200 [Panicum hallii var. hallii]